MNIHEHCLFNLEFYKLDGDEEQNHETLNTVKNTPVTEVDTFAKCGASTRKWAVIPEFALA